MGQKWDPVVNLSIIECKMAGTKQGPSGGRVYPSSNVRWLGKKDVRAIYIHATGCAILIVDVY